MTSSTNIPHIYSSSGFVNNPDWNAFMSMMLVPTRKTDADSPITLDNSKRIWVINTTNGAVSVVLPASPEHGYIIKNKVDSGSSGNNITLSSTETIEDSTIYPGESAELEWNSTEGYFWV